LLIASLALCNVEARAGEVCKLACIEGYWDFCARAHPYQQNSTRRVDRVVLYVEKATDGTFSFASNVKSEGKDYATKIVGFSNLKDLDDVFFNLDDGFQEEVKLNLDVLKTFHDTAEVYVTPEVADSSSGLDFKGVKKIHIIKERR
jgi:hypothetical protein